MRRIAPQIPELVSRLIRANHIETPPTWYSAVMNNPPPRIRPLREKPRLSLDDRQPVYRANQVSKTNKGHSSYKTKKWKVKAIVYEEDQIRRRFFMDFPFEALRPSSLIEMQNVQDAHPVSGEEWVELKQRGAYPSVEDTIAFTITLFKRGASMSQAYQQATGEFVKLRAAHEMGTMAAELEARHYGTGFLDDGFERYYNLELKSLNHHMANARQVAGAVAQTIKWKPKPKTSVAWTTHVDESALPADDFSGGRNYADKWRIYPLPEAVTQAAAAGRKAVVTPPVEQDAKEGEEAKEETEVKNEEDMSDLEFLEQAMASSSRH